MKHQSIEISSQPVDVFTVEGPQDLPAVHEFITSNPLLAVDTETTGLRIFSEDFRMHTLQVGNAVEAFVVPMPNVSIDDMRGLVASLVEPIFHNAKFDALVMDAVGIAPFNETLDKAHDTRIMAHLLDPRGKPEGGTGHGLKALAEKLIGSNAQDSDNALKEHFKANGWNREQGWAQIEADDPVMALYGGMDTVLTFQLYQKLLPLIARNELSDLYEFELQVQSVTTEMENRGFLLDKDYAHTVTLRLAEQWETASLEAEGFGIANVNSPQQVAAALGALGAPLTETTASGQIKVDKAILKTLAAADEPYSLPAQSVMAAKQAKKFQKTFVDSALDLADPAGRVHPGINALQARTGRMSMSKPNLQQLPSSDSLIRSMFIPSPGQTLFAVDYSQVELRILAVLSNEEAMLEAINSGVDLHDLTAAAVFGDDFTPSQRKIAKSLGFGKVYGGGAEHLSRQTGVDIMAVRKALQLYDQSFPAIKRYAKQLQIDADYGAKPLVSPSGRLLPLDRDRTYSATNYMVQSTARDVFAQALVRLKDEGLSKHLLLPVHDEVVGQAPSAEVEMVAKRVSAAMDFQLGPVLLETDTTILGQSWGETY